MAGSGKGRKRWFCGALALCMAFLVACGGETEEGSHEETEEGRTEMAGEEGTGSEEGKSGPQGSEGVTDSRETGKYQDLTAQTQRLFSQEELGRGMSLGMQYYQGEPVLLWAAANLEWNDGAVRITDVYLKKNDGSSTLLVEDAPEARVMESWYLAQDGSIYCMIPDYDQQKTSVVKRDPQGQKLYEKELDEVVTDICQMNDGKIVLILTRNDINSKNAVAELDPETGAVTEMGQVQMGRGMEYIGAGPQGLLILNALEEIREVDVKDGRKTTVLPFSSTSFNAAGELASGSVEDFRVLEDGGVEVLKWRNGEGTVQTLRMTAVDKAPVVVRGIHFSNGWIRELALAFNQSSEDYHLVLQEAGDGVDWDDFVNQTKIEIVAGKGPDIMYGEMLGDSVQGMIDKGGLEDLKPYMEKSGIKEEDYFPIAFSNWRRGDEIYSINVVVNPYRYSMDASVLGGKAGPDVETLVDALLAREEKGMYARFCDSQEILRVLLAGSEDLWGMIDWEKGACDFSGGLLAKILKLAKEYAYDENIDCPILGDRVYCDSLLRFDAPAVQEKDGTVTVGILFDDGCYPAQNSVYQILAINANSSQKEGAWEFIRFLLGEESQLFMKDKFAEPVLRTAFDEMVRKELEELKKEGSVTLDSHYLYRGQYVPVEKTVKDGDVTEEWVNAFRQAAEDTRPFPIRNASLLSIISEEAQDYFGGIKDVDEVIAVIRNRVQLYLDENTF